MDRPILNIAIAVVALIILGVLLVRAGHRTACLAHAPQPILPVSPMPTGQKSDRLEMLRCGLSEWLGWRYRPSSKHDVDYSVGQATQQLSTTIQPVHTRKEDAR